MFDAPQQELDWLYQVYQVYSVQFVQAEGIEALLRTVDREALKHVDSANKIVEVGQQELRSQPGNVIYDTYSIVYDFLSIWYNQIIDIFVNMQFRYICVNTIEYTYIAICMLDAHNSYFGMWVLVAQNPPIKLKKPKFAKISSLEPEAKGWVWQFHVYKMSQLKSNDINKMY